MSAADLRAELAVLVAYDEAREGRPFDMAGGRRRYVIRRLERELREAARGEGYADVTDVELTRQDLDRALRRLTGGLIRRHTTDAVLAALEATRLRLELERPARLDRALNGDGAIMVYPAGASRARVPR